MQLVCFDPETIIIIHHRQTGCCIVCGDGGQLSCSILLVIKGYLMIGVSALAAESLLTVLRPCMVREDNPSSSCIFTGHHLHQDILYCLLCLWTMAWMDII